MTESYDLRMVSLKEAADRHVAGLLANVVAGPDGCAIWVGPVAKKLGHGLFHYQLPSGRKTTTTLHRAIYVAMVGPIGEGLVLDHMCHKPDGSCVGGHLCLHRRCLNHLHLHPTTNGANVLRGMSLSARNAVKTHCHRGHEFTEKNTYHFTQDGRAGRSCRTCHRINNYEPNRARRLRAKLSQIGDAT